MPWLVVCARVRRHDTVVPPIITVVVLLVRRHRQHKILIVVITTTSTTTATAVVQEPRGGEARNHVPSRAVAVAAHEADLRRRLRRAQQLELCVVLARRARRLHRLFDALQRLRHAITFCAHVRVGSADEIRRELVEVRVAGHEHVVDVGDEEVVSQRVVPMQQIASVRQRVCEGLVVVGLNPRQVRLDKVLVVDLAERTREALDVVPRVDGQVAAAVEAHHDDADVVAAARTRRVVAEKVREVRGVALRRGRPDNVAHVVVGHVRFEQTVARQHQDVLVACAEHSNLAPRHVGLCDDGVWRRTVLEWCVTERTTHSKRAVDASELNSASGGLDTFLLAR
eukprot:PhM_4_TR17269/c0_g1_i1/m.6097